ncbi:MAG: imidazole glycerol phosphate synthase subunit HisH [Lachnospiraceae bacterium]|nr:imidazole glycerol phosphate synthase subunit HisH [Lachnospiraceae bacterium]
MIKIIDYKAGNAPSVMHALNHLGFKAEFAKNKSDLANSTHIILPGVGSAKATMESLAELDLIKPLTEKVLGEGVMFFGICVGMQVLFDFSAEENTACLSWLKGQVVKFDREKVRVPQMGWNKVSFANKSGYFYFVNSYYVMPEDKEIIWGTADYNGRFMAAIHRENIWATQFHAEKSGTAGLKLLNRFLTPEGSECLQNA